MESSYEVTPFIRPSQYVKIPLDIFAMGCPKSGKLTPIDVVIYGTLVGYVMKTSFAKNCDFQGSIYISNADIEAMTGFSESTIKRSLKNLIANEILSSIVEKTFGGGNGWNNKRKLQFEKCCYVHRTTFAYRTMETSRRGYADKLKQTKSGNPPAA
jgi:hypothetical protein